MRFKQRGRVLFVVANRCLRWLLLWSTVAVVFVKRSVVNSGKRRYEYLSLVEAFRDEQGRSRQRTIARLGEVSALRASGDLDRIIAALKRFADQDDEDDEDDGPPGWEAVAAPAWGATAAVAAVWDRLALGRFFTDRSGHLSFDLGAAIFVMVLNRLVDPASKRRVIDWLDDDQALPDEFNRPELHHLYRALDHLADGKEDLEAHLWSVLTDLTNLDLSLVCYDLTSTYFEGAVTGSDRFPSKAFGYSRVVVHR